MSTRITALSESSTTTSRSTSTISDSTLIQLDSVNVALNGQRVLHDIDWTLKRGENWAVLGSNGAGKSTFLRLLRGEVWPAPVNGGHRIYNWNGQPSESAIGVKRRMMLVSAELQQRYARMHEWQMTARDVVFTGLFDSELLWQHPTPAQLKQVEATMTQVGIADLMTAKFNALSQGQLRKILIARAIIGQPAVLILDEVGVGLDKHSRLHLLDFIQKVAEGGTQILCTTHRRDELIPAISHVMELKGGRIVVAGERRDGRPGGSEAATTDGRRPATPSWSPVVCRPSSRLPSRVVSAPSLIDIQNADVALDEGAKMVLHDVTWRMNAGENWMILGDNGVGKSTLLKLILGELWPSFGGVPAGSIERFGRKDFRNVWEIKKQIGYVSADFQTRYYVDLPAEKVIASGFFASVGWLQPTTRAQDRRVQQVIEQFGLEPLAKRSILEMSYGQARKVLAARAVVNKPKLIILDEVFDGLDAQFRQTLGEMFEGIAAQGTGLILVSHHDNDLLPCITHRMKIEHGRIASQEARLK